MSQSCPICRRELPPHAENPTHPFCSARCKLIDLGNWLDGAYRIAGPAMLEDEPDDGDEALS